MNIERPTLNVEWKKMKKPRFGVVECSVLGVCFSISKIFAFFASHNKWQVYIIEQYLPTKKLNLS